MEDKIERLCRTLGLGTYIEKPRNVSGGLMHTMLHVSTAYGEYAVKRLNPNIMQRPQALSNMIQSEKIAHCLQDKIPLVSTIEFNGKSVLDFEGDWYMIFPWCDGEAIYAPEIHICHCEMIGETLGRIHASDIRLDGIAPKAARCRIYPWQTWTADALRIAPEIGEILNSYLIRLISWNVCAHDSEYEVNRRQVISHRDLDPKNVLWHDNRPIVIDWESAGVIHPAQELIEVIRYWTADVSGGYHEDMARSLLRAYHARMDISTVLWDKILDFGYANMLGWLAYNLRRVLGQEDASDSSRCEGAAQVVRTLRELEQYDLQREHLKIWVLA